ncbi:MAG: flagellar biosynthesis regulator FlaF [Alphaproteobacteria bacterium]|nr:flagellar biosynthesis regulator FlaF [Alphaproteobacteria bacterium]
MPSNKTTNNPYAQAASAYGDHAQKFTPDQRELEARVLLKAAKMMTDLQADWDNSNREVIESTLKYNRQIWLMFYDTAMENKDGDRPKDLRSNIVNLSNFIFKREVDILFEPKKEKFDVLININKEIAAGLMTKPNIPDKNQ